MILDTIYRQKYMLSARRLARVSRATGAIYIYIPHTLFDITVRYMYHIWLIYIYIDTCMLSPSHGVKLNLYVHIFKWLFLNDFGTHFLAKVCYIFFLVFLDVWSRQYQVCVCHVSLFVYLVSLLQDSSGVSWVSIEPRNEAQSGWIVGIHKMGNWTARKRGTLLPNAQKVGAQTDFQESDLSTHQQTNN